MTTLSKPLPTLLTIIEVAHHLRLCTKTVRRLIDSGTLPACRIGRLHRINEADLRAYISRAG